MNTRRDKLMTAAFAEAPGWLLITSERIAVAKHLRSGYKVCAVNLWGAGIEVYTIVTDSPIAELNPKKILILPKDKTSAILEYRDKCETYFNAVMAKAGQQQSTQNWVEEQNQQMAEWCIDEQQVVELYYDKTDNSVNVNINNCPIFMLEEITQDIVKQWKNRKK